MMTVEQALDALFALVSPLETEQVEISQAAGRVLARDVVALRDQPPFAASAMDGYAVAVQEVAPGAQFTVIGESAAGHGRRDALGTDEAVRIFTGAPVPENAARIILQEDVTRDGARITVTGKPDPASYIRPAAGDFKSGDRVPAPRLLRPADIALFAAMNQAEVCVTRRPRVAIIATGDELVAPGEQPNEDQIIASNSYGLHAMMRALGAEARLLPIARDTVSSLRTVFDLADDADLVVTIGGASVGDHDLVAKAAEELGMDRAFYKVAMRPGKPLMAGRLGTAMMIGLPGNPVSAMVCGHVFLTPVVRHMQGLPAQARTRQSAPLAEAIGTNGARAHYMRASLDADGLRVFSRQDSALLGVLAQSDALVVRPPHDGPRAAGEMVEFIAL